MKHHQLEKGFGIVAIFIVVVAALATVGGSVAVVNRVQENKEQREFEEFVDKEIENKNAEQFIDVAAQEDEDKKFAQQVVISEPDVQTVDQSEDKTEEDENEPEINDPAQLTSPTNEKLYGSDDTVRISWSPDDPGVETIELNRPNGGWGTYYAKKVHGDPINTKGYWDLDISNWSLDSGVYDIRISSPSFGSNFVDVEYDAFEIISDPPEITSPTTEKAYEPGDTIRISWSPDEPGIENIEIREPNGNWYFIHSWKVFSYPINTKGYFDYVTPPYLDFGTYDIRLSSPSFGLSFEYTEYGAFQIIGDPSEITSPTGGETYESNNTIRIRWNPDEPGVETIEIRAPGDGWSTYYAKKVHGDPINTKGYWDLDLNNWGSLGDPGYYDIRISSPTFGSDFEHTEYNAFKVL